MARIYPPTTGTVVAHGTVAPMIELGVGFHPDLPGHESIFPNTSLLRLSSRKRKRSSVRSSCSSVSP
jgi:ABC-type polysaccharide/polyol phosphate transport system ATPase subunit